MQNPDWIYAETLQKKIRIVSVNLKERHLDALDMDAGVPLCLEAEEKINLGKIKKAKIYQATIKVYNAELTSDMERQLREMSIRDTHLLQSLQAIKKAGSILKKYELSSIKF